MPLVPRRVALWGLAAYGVLLGGVALWPQPVDRPVAGLLARALGGLHRHGIPGWVDYGFVEAAANVLLFVPLGALVAWTFGRRYWWVGAVAGLVISSAIELAQFLFLPDRYGTLADVGANSTGALLGALLAFLRLRRRRPVRNEAGA